MAENQPIHGFHHKDGPGVITYLTHEQIDRHKWDQCISTSVNGLIYGYSNYLDCMSKHWDALVLNEYEAVMPLTWNRKYRVHYLYQPFLTACLGVFGSQLNAGLVNRFLSAIPAKFRYVDICLNHGNLFHLKQFSFIERMNHVLSLNQPYETLYGSYRENVKRNIRQAYKVGCVVKTDFDVDQVILLALEQFKLFTKVSKEDFEQFKKLYHHFHSLKEAVTYGITSAAGQLLASSVFLFSHKRAYYILVGNHPDGKTLGASHALIDAFIRDHASQDLTLDFEGSDVSKIAFFYKGFGATEEKYPRLLSNRLPPLLKWLKT